MTARRLKRARCAAMARRFARLHPRCPECGKPGPHWVGAGFWAAVGFWTCAKFYGPDGRGLSL